MKRDALQQHREAGLMLVAACEQALNVSGPTGLARLTGRSKSWWSKLASGTAAFPTWEEMEALLPPALPSIERESLHHHYRRAWLGLYEPELVQRLDSSVPARASLVEMQVLLTTAMVLGYVQGEHERALRLQRILEMLFVARGIEALSREELDMLRDCLHHQSICEGELGNYEASIVVAHRSVEYQQQGGSRLGELSARHLVGLAQHNAGVQQRDDFLAKALSRFEALQREYQRLGLIHELIRAQRDQAITRMYMGRREEGEARLIEAYEVRQQSGEDRFLTAMWLADVTLRRGDVPLARRWLARLRVITRRHPEEIARLMVSQHVSHHVAGLERSVADIHPPRRS